LLHIIGLLARCQRIPGGSTRMRAGWERGTLKAVRDLELLYDSGLRRDFLGAPVTRPGRN
jgi:hypothetical protein